MGDRCTHRLVLGSGEQWWSRPAQLKGQTLRPWLGGTQLWQVDRLSSEPGPGGNCPTVGGQLTPPWRLRSAFHGWGRSVHQLDTFTWDVPAAVTSGNEQLVLPALFNNWLQNWGGLGYVPTPLDKPYCPCWTENQQALKQLQLHLKTIHGKTLFGATVLGQAGKQKKHIHTEKRKKQTTKHPNLKWFHPALLWAERTAKGAENCQQSLPAHTGLCLAIWLYCFLVKGNWCLGMGKMGWSW